MRRTYGPAARRVAYEFPYVAVATLNDPFDSRTHPAAYVQDWAPHLELLPVGTLLVWDDWFARTETRLPLAQLRADARFRQRWEGARPRDPHHPERDTTRVLVFERMR